MIEQLTYKYYAYVVEIIDGDTIKLNIDLGFDTWIKKKNIRIKGINSEEVFGKNATNSGKEAKSFLENLIPVGTKVVIHTEKFRKSFERYVGDMYLEDGQSISDIMIEKGYAVRM